MGYRAQSTVLVLTWPEGHTQHGLEIKAKPVSISTIRKMLGLAALTAGTIRAEDISQIDELFTTFIGKVVSWNLEHEASAGQWAPTPITMAGLEEHDTDLVMDVVLTWLNAASGKVDDGGELGKDSPAGSPSPGLSLTMEAL